MSLARYSSFTLRWLLLVLAGLRLVVAARMPLSADEAYYWVWSKALAPGFLDHPPMVALWIKAGTLVAGDSALGVRLLGPVSALLGTLMIGRAARDFWPGVTGAPVAAMALLNATLVLNAGAVIMTPDTPLLFFWVAALATLGRLISSGQPGWWLGFGLFGGLALDSKYTAVLLGASVMVWVVLVPGARRWLRCWQFWSAAGLALLVFMPVVAWNIFHGLASFAKQGGRAGYFRPAMALKYLGELFAGQIGLATPLVFCVLAAGVWRVARRWRDPAMGLLACVTLLPIAVFAEHALGDRVQANWAAIVYPGAVLAACGVGRRYWRPSAAVGLMTSAAIYLQAVAAPLQIPRKLDFTLIRLAGWADLAGQVYVMEQEVGASFVVADAYGLASELAFRLHGEVDGADPRWALFDLPHAQLSGRTGLLIRSDRDAGEPDPAMWSATLIGHIARQRHGIKAESYRVYRVVWRDIGVVARLPEGRKTVLF